MNKRILLWRNAVCGLAFCALLAGCGRRQPDPVPEPPPLVRVGEASITEEDFRFEVERRLAVGRPVGDVETVLREMIERQAMLRKASDSEVARDPGVRRDVENRLLTAWLDRELHAEKDRVTVTESDLRAAYEATLETWTVPAQARLAILYRRRTPRDGEEAVEELKVALRGGVAAFEADRAGVTRNGQIPGFGTVAAEHSEDTVTRYRGGDLGWLDIGRTESRLPALVLETGFALDLGGISDVLETEDGLYVVMKSDERAARVQPFEQAATVLRRRLIRERQDAVEQRFMQDLLAETPVEINREKAARLTIPRPESSVRPPAFSPVTERTTLP